VRATLPSPTAPVAREAAAATPPLAGGALAPALAAASSVRTVLVLAALPLGKAAAPARPLTAAALAAAAPAGAVTADQAPLRQAGLAQGAADRHLRGGGRAGTTAAAGEAGEAGNGAGEGAQGGAPAGGRRKQAAQAIERTRGHWHFLRGPARWPDVVAWRANDASIIAGPTALSSFDYEHRLATE
jgi:hypothetical protein